MIRILILIALVVYSTGIFGALTWFYLELSGKEFKTQKEMLNAFWNAWIWPIAIIKYTVKYFNTLPEE